MAGRAENHQRVPYQELFHLPQDGYLFSYFEYDGNSYEADMARMAADPETQRWWDVCKPCQQPLETRAPGEWWANMEEVFH
jgi:L-rhamnose mutarotase